MPKRSLEIAAGVLAGVMVAASLAQILLALTNGLPLFLITALLTALLSLPVWMETARSPDVAVEPDGLALRPALWRDRVIPFSVITALKDDPSQPPEGAEVYRRKAVGKSNYSVARGKLLVIPSLPIQYRIAGWFAGEGLVGVISVNSRSHADYDRLIAQIEKRWHAASSA